MKKKVLVTGVSGFVGQHCAVELLKQGYHVKGSLRDLSKGEKIRQAISKVIDPNDQLEFCELDLTKDQGWEDALKDCDFLLHVASPFIFKQTNDENELIKPAVEGTLRALSFAQKCKVKRVVLTSSIAAMSAHMYHGEFTPDNWTDLNDKNLSTYVRSKTLAEKAAWDFYKNQKAGHKIELVVINPGGITGPTITNNLEGTSMDTLVQLITGKMSMIPDVSFPMVDVRDVATLHVMALTEEAAKGKRFIAAHKQATHYMDLAILLKKNGYEKVSTKKAPLFLLKVIGLFNKEVKALLTIIGKHVTADISQTKKVFGWEPMSMEKSALDMAKSVENALNKSN
ncbi:aldehyde reductase [Algoriphagus sp.]|uniref:SDR family oxidoreductase n=1 Tax=Algoriphagus sp. TaxID=1872435 RepID=UPI0025E560D2|nr:aldehyde reductase [Algoriphagus sp.]